MCIIFFFLFGLVVQIFQERLKKFQRIKREKKCFLLQGKNPYGYIEDGL